MRVTLFEDLKSEGWLSMDRYANNLARGLSKIQGLEVQRFCPEPPRWLPSLKFLAKYTPAPWIFAHPKRFLYYPFKAQGAQSEINHILDHSYSHVAHWLDPKKTIVTCHDLIPLQFEEDKLALSIYEQAISGLRKTKRIIAVSQSTKRALVEFLGISDERIDVVYQGVEEKFQRSKEIAVVLEKYHLPKGRLLLHVGSSLKYKNIEGILGALPKVIDTFPDVWFVKVGGDLTSDQKKLARKLQILDRVIYLGRVVDDDLPGIYSACDLTLMPSLSEGFGLTVLESLACGTPILCSKKGSLPEVGGEVAFYVDDETDASSLAGAIVKALKVDKNKITDGGIRWARKFTWEKTARETAEVYKKVRVETFN